MLKTLSRYYHTIKHLKLIQIRYQVWYRLRDKFKPVQYSVSKKTPAHQPIKVAPFPKQYTHYLSDNRFHFLNIKHTFSSSIDWNYLEYGKLWAYHLNYFDFLHQEGMDWERGCNLIDDFLLNPQNRREGLDPYPISLRTINWIKFFAVHQKFPKRYIEALYSQYNVLLKKTEYHLLGNHLLENGFSFLFGAIFIKDKKLEKQAKRILSLELDEQFCEDGAHFELSPMYHIILLQRALDGYNLLVNNEHNLKSIQAKLYSVISKMVDWLYTIRFKNGDIPLFNDSTFEQSLDSDSILTYAKSFGFVPKNIDLTDSGYRKFNAERFELIADVGEVSPSYQPGHTHSDALSFVLYHDGTPIIVDPGISTYEKNSTRQLERSTRYHNTVMVGNREQTDVWGGFRVGRRASVQLLIDDDKKLKASHDGYKMFNINPERTWEVNKSKIYIKDYVLNSELENVAYLHFHPDCEVIKINNELFRLNKLIFQVEGSTDAILEDYDFGAAFNKRIQAKKLVIRFRGELKTTIKHENLISD